VLNELLAYIDLQAPEARSAPAAGLMMTYALCGFANFGSLGIMIGGLATLARSAATRSFRWRENHVSGTLATCVAGSSWVFVY